MFSISGNFVVDSNLHVAVNIVESVTLYTADPFLSMIWEMLRVWREGEDASGKL